MKKLSQFLNYIEEKFIIRFGRQIWQVIGFLSILAFLASLFIVIGNLIPTARKEVHISKKEFEENKIDRDFDESNNFSSCSKSEYKIALDSLKIQMPNSEWVNLTKTVRIKRYRDVYRYDPWYGSYSSYEPYYVWEETKNYDAVPVILDNIYSSKGIDSTEYCGQIKIVRAITSLMNQTQKDVATDVLKDNYRNLLSYNDLQKEDIDRSIEMYKSVNGKKPFIVNPNDEKDPWNKFSSYLYLYTNDSISEERDLIAMDATMQLKKKGIKNIEFKNDMAIWVLSNEMDDEATKTACDDLFQSSVFKFNKNNFEKSAQKYIYLYIEKYRLAESLKASDEMEKYNNIELYGSSGLVSFGSILAIASILILYSIRQILKDKKD